MRLMTSEKGAETPMEKYIRYKNNINLWYDEMNREGLTENEIKAVEPYFKDSYGVPPSQEQLMKMLMDENICGFSLKDANAARKIVGKKLMNKIPALREQVYNQATSPALGKYIWKYGAQPQMGYSFSIIHALAYSFIGYQTAYLATKWNPIYWDTSCLVVNSGSLETSEQEIVDIYEKEDFENYKYIDLPERKGKIKEKNSDYAKIAKAIGDITSRGINVSLVNINESDYGFKPDVKNNRILYGLKALSNVNNETIEKIKAGRPYKSFKDFMKRCSLTKLAMINLIKAGAFDELESDLDRLGVMVYYLYKISEPKTKLNLQNFNGLINKDLVPKNFELQIRIYNFTKYLKKYRKKAEVYVLDEISINFLEKFMPEALDFVEDNMVLNIKTWDKIYQTEMDKVREWLKENQEEVLELYNQALFMDIWEKYAKGTLSRWEMDSLCFYHGEHELANVNVYRYGIADFNKLQSCEVDYYFKKKGKQIPIYKLYRIIGTVIAKNDNKSSISLLTTTGVVTVKFTREYYAMFKKQISQIQPDGTKKVVEPGWFKRGTLLVITGYRRDDMFVAKTYAKTETHQLYKIDQVIGDEIVLRHERFSQDGTIEEDYEE